MNLIMILIDKAVFYVSSFSADVHISLDGFSGRINPSGILLPPGVPSGTLNLSQSHLQI